MLISEDNSLFGVQLCKSVNEVRMRLTKYSINATHVYLHKFATPWYKTHVHNLSTVQISLLIKTGIDRDRMS